MFRFTGTVLLLLLAMASAARSQAQTATLKGRITDDTGASIPGATVMVTGAGGFQKMTTTDQTGAYSIAGLAPGSYTVRASAPGFALLDQKVNLAPAAAQALDFGMKVAIQQQEVTVQGESGPQVSTEASSNASQLVLKGDDLDALPDDPDDLASDLQALAGPSAGPNGGQIYVDGFSNAQLPPKASIREIRINQNPFSAEYDRLGFGRIEILTKPGSDKFRGQLFYNSGDAIFNSRNPFAPDKPDFALRQYGGNLSGPLSKRASFFFDAERREIDDNAVINAQIVDPTTFLISPLSQAVVTPQRRTTLTPRLDYQLSTNNTLTLRYSYTRVGRDNQGIGQFSLLSQAYNTFNTEQSFYVTETAVLGTHVVNETRFHFLRDSTGTNGDNTKPAIDVLDAFNGGGAQVGIGYNHTDRWELQNYTSVAHGAHAVKFGMRLRATTLQDSSPQNFGGTFTFSGGGLGPVLDASNQPVIGPDGTPELEQITSVERYRRTLLFQQLGLSATQIQQLGGGATQFSISGGSPLASLTQVDVGPFLQDDWRVRPNFTLSLGLRYETQTNLHDWRDIAPRLGFAWAPGGTGRRNGKTVIRGGFGMFYDRLGESTVLQAIRYNGINQQQYIVMNPDFFPNVPPIQQLNAQQLPQTIRPLDSNLRAAALIQSALGIERQLPWNTTIASTFTWSHADHLLLSRNINAPLPGTYTSGQPSSGVRPYGDIGNVFQYESIGRMEQKQWITNINSRLNRNLSIFGFYALNYARSNSDGGSPANPYDLTADWGRSSLDRRHRVVMGGSFVARGGWRLSPFVMVNSGAPYNITIGRDLNGDTAFADRPALATDPTKPGLVLTPWGLLDPNPSPGEKIIPRNFAEGPGFASVNLRLSKTFGFGGSKSAAANAAPGMMGGGEGRGGRGGGPGGGAMRMGGGGMHGMFGDSMTEKRYNLMFYAMARNLFNHTNPASPDGSLASPFFGQSTQLAGGFGPASEAGNRRVELGLRFSF